MKVSRQIIHWLGLHLDLEPRWISPDRVGEFIFLAERYALMRNWFCFNYFSIVGPANGPVSGTDVKSYLSAINSAATGSVTFVSRGAAGASGTYVREQQIWQLLGITSPNNVVSAAPGSDDMMSTIETAAATTNGYTMSDLGTWYTYKTLYPSSTLTLLTPGDLTDTCASNQYVTMPVNANACLPSGTTINTAGALDFMNWLLSSAGQNVVNTFGQSQNATKPGFVWNAEVTPGEICLIKAVPEV